MRPRNTSRPCMRNSLGAYSRTARRRSAHRSTWCPPKCRTYILKNLGTGSFMCSPFGNPENKALATNEHEWTRIRKKCHGLGLLDSVVDLYWVDHADAGGLEELDRGVGLVEAEDHHRGLAASLRERVHVLDVDRAVLEHLKKAGEAAGLVGDFDGHDLGGVDYVAGVLQEFRGALPVGDDHAEDAELLSVRDGQGADVDSLTGQQPAGFHDLARLVLKEQGQLLDFHASFLRSITRLALPSLRWRVCGSIRLTLTRRPRACSIACVSFSFSSTSARIRSPKTSGVTST